MVLVKDEEMLVTGGADSELRVWGLKWMKEDKENSAKKKLIVPCNSDTDTKDDAKDDLEDDGSNLTVTRLGSVLRKGEGRVGGLVVDRTGRVLACHGSDNMLEMFVICSQEEVDRRVARRLKKEKKRTGEEVTGETAATLQEMVRRVREVRLGGKVRAVDLLLTKAEVRGLAVLANNLLEVVTLDLAAVSSNSAPEVSSRLDQAGHRSDVRAVAWSSDNTCLVTGSSEAVKLWNRTSLNCVRTLASGYCLALAFCPGDRHVVAATKAGNLEIFELGSGAMVETISAHGGQPVWGLALGRDKRGLVSGGGDKTVKWWDWQLTETGQLSATHTRQVTFQSYFLQYINNLDFSQAC